MASIVGPVLNIYGGEPTDGVDGWRIAINTSLAKMDAVISLSVKSRSYSKPASGITSGDRDLVMDQASWDSQPVGTIAVYGKKPDGSSGWNYYTPVEGMVCYVVNEDKTYRYLSGVWAEVPYSASTYIIPNVGVMSGLATTVAADGATVIDTYLLSQFRSCKYTIQVSNADKYHVTEILVTSTLTTPKITEYAKFFTDSELGTFDVDVYSNSVRLTFTRLLSATMTIRLQKTLLYP